MLLPSIYSEVFVDKYNIMEYKTYIIILNIVATFYPRFQAPFGISTALFAGLGTRPATSWLRILYHALHCLHAGAHKPESSRDILVRNKIVSSHIIYEKKNKTNACTCNIATSFMEFTPTNV